MELFKEEEETCCYV